MSRIYWDSMLFVYWMEDHPVHAPRLHEIRDRMRTRNDILCTSIFTIGEVLTGFYKRGIPEVANEVRQILRAPLVELIPFTGETADRFAQIRAANRISPADAIHMASAAQSNINLFLTNDRRLSKTVVSGVDFIAGLDANFF